MFQTSPFCPYRAPDITTWSYQTRGFCLLITSWHIFPFHYFTLAPFFAFSLISLSHINSSFVMKMSCLLPRAKLQRVTFFMMQSYLLPRENFKLCHISQTRHTGIPVFALNWDLVTSILYTKHRANSSKGTLGIWPLFVPFDPAAAARGRRSLQLPSSVVPPWVPHNPLAMLTHLPLVLHTCIIESGLHWFR